MKCGNEKCAASTGIHGGPTFGSGRLDHNGFWEFPCRVCAADWDAGLPELKEKMRQEMLAQGKLPLDIAQYIVNADWLNYAAWPHANTDIAKETTEIQERLNKEEAEWAEFDQFFPELNDIDELADGNE